MHKLLRKARAAYKDGGVLRLAEKGAGWAVFYIVSVPAKTFLHYFYQAFRYPRHPRFMFRGVSFLYFYHLYNFTWQGERIVEIPIARRFVEESLARGDSILEVGNVLPHYIPFPHDVLDKFEEGRDVIHEDIASFAPRGKYDAIVSVSTMEHVGWDFFDDRDSEKLLVAFENLMRCLKSHGRMLVTMPLGYNPFVDRCLEEKRFPFTEMYFLKRISKVNEWREVPYEEVRGTLYNSPYFAANAIVVGVVEKN